MLARDYNAPGSFNELKQGRSSLYSKPDVDKQIGGLNFSFATDMVDTPDVLVYQLHKPFTNTCSTHRFLCTHLRAFVWLNAIIKGT